MDLFDLVYHQLSNFLANKQLVRATLKQNVGELVASETFSNDLNNMQVHIESGQQPLS